MYGNIWGIKMNIQSDKSYLVFKKQTQYGPMYSLGLSKKGQDGKYQNGYIGCKFKNGVDIENKTNIYIKNGWLTFYLDKSNKTVPYIFINEFTTVEQTIEQAKESDPLDKAVNEFANEIELTDADLPF